MPHSEFLSSVIIKVSSKFLNLPRHNGVTNNIQINVIIKVKVTYKDGIEKTDYYKVKADIQGMESMELYKLE